MNEPTNSNHKELTTEQTTTKEINAGKTKRKNERTK